MVTQGAGSVADGVPGGDKTMSLAQLIFRPNPWYPSCHAATIVEPAAGVLLAAWFAGTYEGHPDVAIWLARYENGAWSDPVKIVDEPDVPHWNPVLFRDTTGTLWLFYKIGPSVPAWTGVYITSQDGGRSWSTPVRLPAGLIGPAKNKPIRSPVRGVVVSRQSRRRTSFGLTPRPSLHHP